MDIRMYVMTHKALAEIPDETYIPLHVGCEGKEELGYLGDNTGDNISQKNANYCELTGLYWIWKNVNCDIVGVCHYRRFFSRNGKILDRSYIEQKLEQYDMIVPNTSCANAANVREHYAARHYVKDLDLCREVIEENYPNYLQAFDFAMETKWISVGNMWITKKEFFDRYCEWLFGILFEVEKRIEMLGYDDYQKRVFGFLSERLFRVWLLMEAVSVKEEKVDMIELADFENQRKRTELIYECIKLQVDPVLKLCEQGKGEYLISEMKTGYESGENRPVWICNLEQEVSSEYLKEFVKQVKEKLEVEETEIYVITLENCLEYVTLSDSIIQQFNAGMLYIQQLRELIFAEVLYRYGGVWIAAKKENEEYIKKEVLVSDLYSPGVGRCPWDTDIVQGRWITDFWTVKKEHPLMLIILDVLLYYYEVVNERVEKNLLDYAIAIAIEMMEGQNTNGENSANRKIS